MTTTTRREAIADATMPVATGIALVAFSGAIFVWLTGACAEAPYFIAAGGFAGFVGGLALGRWCRRKERP